MSNVTLETLTRVEAHRKLLALGMPVGQVTHVLDHPSELLNAMRPAFTVAATEDAVAIVAAYQRHCTTRTDPIDAVSAEGRERIAQRATRLLSRVSLDARVVEHVPEVQGTCREDRR